MTGRVAILLLALMLVPMLLTSWMIEQGWLLPGKNLYCAVPIFLLILIVPLARSIAFWLINRDLVVINRFCDEIKNGNYQVGFDLVREEEDEDQFIVLLRNLSWMSHALAVRQASIHHSFDQVIQKYQRVEEQARTDPLTGLCNRRYFDRMLYRQAASAADAGESLSLIFIDCDKFKEVNDTLGHQAGDQALVGLAENICSGIRTGNDLAFRFGGDEFAVLLPRTSGKQAMEVAQRILALHRQTAVGGMTLSIGIGTTCCLRDHWEEQAEAILRTADQRTYAVKARGGNGIDLENLCFGAKSDQTVYEKLNVVKYAKKY
ncbi:GGDEF domain-containing protein [Desulfobulbus alkaliphilus]|uniref:GGDEF domain-containing protein n=1 Tax=Desulfobulbus alkaliphilus TaxID=869814 RepID=UPI00196682E2|nr:GGDEF domain-containing protein [Desulfobulbus alkaliphilus]